MRKSLFVAIGSLLTLGVVAVGSSPGIATPPCHEVGPPAHDGGSVYLRCVHW